MRFRLPSFLSPFILLLIAIPLIATALPARGGTADALDYATIAAVCLLFFLHGAKLTPSDAREGFTRWQFQLVVLACTFVVFPLLGIALTLLPASILSPVMATGFLFLAILPSTVQSSIAFTSIARGNVALAVSSASISNVLGVVLTPLLAGVLLGSSVHITPKSLLGIVGELVVPFVAGQLLHKRMRGFLKRNHRVVSIVDQGSVLLVVYAAFSIGVTQGLWTVVPPSQLLMVVAVSVVLLAVVLGAFFGLGKAMRLPRGDAIVLLFCGSKKSQVSGLPMATLLFPAAQVGMYVLPLMIFHIIQLLVCAVLANRYAATAPVEPPDEPVAAVAAT
ncbi:bile acid:sodium symporter family protein [Gordonia phthalatica]|uniref:Membrane protein n=1 Tax=Gordonia phthalatica TaxID=1136941 RepID=A0A0N7FU54_9ACTN|nr:bile acid:sodium symporter family protein [Gordonia phthalatica]ALG83407.1 membrane protein [Gordonia phthalatica]